jgi:hypothetical protein
VQWSTIQLMTMLAACSFTCVIKRNTLPLLQKKLTFWQGSISPHYNIKRIVCLIYNKIRKYEHDIGQKFSTRDILWTRTTSTDIKVL